MIFLELFGVFFLIGAFTFGGGYAMIAMVQQQVVAMGWMDAASVIDFVAIAESTPGPIAVNMATFVGAQMGGPLGAVCATLGVVLPSFVVILVIARCYRAFRDNRWVQAVMRGLKPAVVGLIASAALSVALAAFPQTGMQPSTWFWLAAGGGLLFLAFRVKKLHPIVIICFSAIIGIAAGFLGI